MRTTATQSEIEAPLMPGPRRRLGAAIIALALGLAIVLAAVPAWNFVAAQTKLSRAAGQVVPDFALRDVRTGQLHRLSDHDSRVVVVIFCGTHWPQAETYLPRLSAYAAAGEMQKVDYIGINANANESADEITDQARALRVRFPMLKDPENRVADLLCADHLGEALVIDRQGRLRYRGAIDDQFSSDLPRDKPSHNDLLDAIDAVVGGKVVSPVLTPVVGPVIERIVE